MQDATSFRSRIGLDLAKHTSGLNRFLKTESGQDVIEYVLLCGLLAVVGAALAVSVGNSISTAYNNIGAKQGQTLGVGSQGQGDGHGNGGDGNGKGKGNSKH